MMNLQCSEGVPHQSSMVLSSPQPTMSKTGKNMPENQIPCYYLLTDWFLRATIGNYRHSVMGLYWLVTMGTP